MGSGNFAYAGEPQRIVAHVNRVLVAGTKYAVTALILLSFNVEGWSAIEFLRWTGPTKNA